MNSMSKFKCDLCTEMFSSESYLMQKENEIYQLKYDMFMTFERDKGKDYTCAISSWVMKVGANSDHLYFLAKVPFSVGAKKASFCRSKNR